MQEAFCYSHLLILYEFLNHLVARKCEHCRTLYDEKSLVNLKLFVIKIFFYSKFWYFFIEKN